MRKNLSCAERIAIVCTAKVFLQPQPEEDFANLFYAGITELVPAK